MNSSDVSVAGGVGSFIFLWMDFRAEAHGKAMMNALGVGLGDRA